MSDRLKPDNPNREFPVAVPLVLVAALASACSSSTTYGTGEAPEVALLRELGASTGIGGSKKEPIDYKPRSPLVKPPTTALPSPEAATADSGAWPDDPDRRTKSGPRDAFAGLNAHEQRDKMREIRALRDEALAAEPNGAPRVYDDPEKAGVPNPYEQRDAGKRFKAALAKETGIGEKRRYLTEPPDAYRKPVAGAPTSVQPEHPKKKGFFARMLGR